MALLIGMYHALHHIHGIGVKLIGRTERFVRMAPEFDVRVPEPHRVAAEMSSAPSAKRAAAAAATAALVADYSEAPAAKRQRTGGN